MNGQNGRTRFVCAASNCEGDKRSDGRCAASVRDSTRAACGAQPTLSSSMDNNGIDSSGNGGAPCGASTSRKVARLVIGTTRGRSGTLGRNPRATHALFRFLFLFGSFFLVSFLLFFALLFFSFLIFSFLFFSFFLSFFLSFL